jgi:hypothetical protein
MGKVAIAMLVLYACSGGAKSVHATGLLCHPPVCGKTCSPQARTVEEKHPCYRIECREICIPAVTFPWQKQCGPTKCGKVIRVNVLEQTEKTQKKCQYTWPIRPTCAACGPIAQPVVAQPTR